MSFRKRQDRFTFLLCLPLLTPLSSALSLANFQELTSSDIPLACQLAYDAPIPDCKVSDFKKGCSATCEDALSSVANLVGIACAGTNASPQSLLGVVQNGDIIGALCSSPGEETSSAKPTATSSEKTTSTTEAVTTTTSETTSSSPTQSSTVLSTPLITSTSSTSTTSTFSIISSSPADSQSSSTPTDQATSLTTSSTTKSKAPASTSKSTPLSQNEEAAGGSPFDIDSGAGKALQVSWMTSLVTIALAVLLLVR